MVESPYNSPTLPMDDRELEVVPERGTSVGRFLVLGTLGMGGMGVVLSAYDPHLDRKVALKLLRGDTWHENPAEPNAAREAIAREAKAMARLTHPNVVAVYEVGLEQDGEQGGYVVMEQVDGVTLRNWMRQKERGWREVLDVLTAAGAGLAEAHRVGVVHQDFKPENVLIGDDGRPRVSDFGLAGTGALGAGTKGYAPPEQLAAEEVDARTDQFAFCVTLWEALAGERPEPDPDPPAAGRKVPPWIWRALRRGLAARREDRWPSMDALLVALRHRAPVRARLAVAAVLALAVGAGGFVVGRTRVADASPCGGAEARLAGVWDEARKEVVRAAFTATGLPYRDAAWRVTRDRVDDYTGRWLAMHVEACRATRIEGRQSDTLLDLRMACLERRRAFLGALTTLWTRGLDSEGLEAAPDAAAGLPGLAECADGRALAQRTPPPTAPAAASAVTAVQGEIDLVRLKMISGHPREARQAAATIRAHAAATGWPQVQAEAALAEGRVRVQLEDDGAAPLLLEAHRFASQSGDDRIAAEALVHLVKVYTDEQTAERALVAADIADGEVLRAGDEDTARLDLLRARAGALRVLGRYEEAMAALGTARERATAVYGPAHPQTLLTLTSLANVASSMGDFILSRSLLEETLRQETELLGDEHPQVAVVLNLLGTSLLRAGDYPKAAEMVGRAVAIREKVYGPEGQPTLAALNNLANVDVQRGRYEEARALFERVLAARRKSLPADSPRIASVEDNLGIVVNLLGRPEEALEHHRRALGIMEKAHGAGTPEVASVHSNLGAAYLMMDDPARALEEHQQALAVRAKVLGAAHPSTLASTGNVADALARLDRCPEARPLIDSAVAGLEASSGPDHPATLEVRLVAARCDLAAGGDPARALATLERALALDAQLARPAVEVGVARFLQARALWAVGRRDEALAAARRAETELATSPAGARPGAAAAAWLAAHGGRSP